MLLLPGCLIFPATIIAPLDLKVLDAQSGVPIEGAQVLRVVCDIHDFYCSHGIVDRTRTGADGRVTLPGKSRWGIYVPAPGGLPVPCHIIAIWKEGYSAFLFTQYNRVDENLLGYSSREDIVAALKEIPQDRKSYSPDTFVFHNDQVKLFRNASSTQQ